MDFLLELLFGIFFEVPMELTMESKTLKPWVKTLAFFLVGNLLTVLLLLIYGSMSKDPLRTSDAQAALYFAIGWVVVLIVLCFIGHRSRWGANKTCNFVRTAAAPAENVPNADVVIRTATMDDLNQIARVEAECFPAAEAAGITEFKERLEHYADHFWLMFEGDKLISFVDGFVTDETDLRDEMYADASLHNPNGAWQMIFGVNTIPSHRRHGYAGQLIQRAIADAKAQGRKGLVLTCKPEKVVYYTKFGFMNEGISKNSTHGGATWHQMRLIFE